MGLCGPDRLGAPDRPKCQPKQRPVRRQKTRKRLAVKSRLKPAVFERAAALKLRCIGIAPRHLALVDLEPGDCRYPYGGDEESEAITFCGHPRRQDSSYCVSHFHLTHGPGTPSERSATKVLLRLVEAA
jgi:GcrA cell cycle regulator